MPFAQVNQLPELPDGDYEINVGSGPINFQVYTVQTGQLAGQRILKRRMAGGWKGFANIRVTSIDVGHLTPEFEGLYTWRSQRENVTEEYVNQCAMAIHSFIARVRNQPEPHFIVINDCPIIPDVLRQRLNPESPFDPSFVDEDGTRRSVGYARSEREILNGARRHREAVANATSHVLRGIDDREPVRRERRCAMSFFDDTVVR